MYSETYAALIEKIDEFIRKYYKNQLLRGFLLSTSSVLLFFLAIAIAEYFGQFETTIRTILFYVFLVGTFIIIVKLIFIPLFRLYKLGKIISHKEAATIIGTHFADVKDKLLNILQLNEQAKINSLSSELIQASINQKIIELKPIAFPTAIKLSENKKYIKYLMPPFLLFISIISISPSIITKSTERLVKHQTYYEKPAPFTFTFNNESLSTIKQKDFTLNVTVTGTEIPSELFIIKNNNPFKFKKLNKTTFEFTFKNPQSNERFQLKGGDIVSKEYELKVLPKPTVLNFSIKLNYPPYTNKKEEVLSNIGDFTVPEGTKVNWSFRTYDTDKLLIQFPDTTTHLKQDQKDNFSFSKVLLNSSSYSIVPHNNIVDFQEPISYQIITIKDEFPKIDVFEQVDSLNTKALYFRGTISDDYGFQKLRFIARFVNKEKKEKGESYEEIAFHKTSRESQFYHVWDLSKLNIEPGDKLEYYFEVWDNDGINGSKSSQSLKKLFKAPTLQEIKELKDQTNDGIKKDLTATIKEAQQVQEELKKMRQKMLDKKRLNWEEKQQITDLLSRQKELQKNLENIQKKNETSLRKQQEYNQIDEKLLEKPALLQKLFDEIMTDELKAMYEEMQEMLEKQDKNKIQEKLEEMQFTNEDIEKELDRSLELFKQLEFEQNLQEAIDKLDELAEKQEKLGDETKNEDLSEEELSQKQEELNKEFSELREDLDELEKENKDLEFPNDMANTDVHEQEIQEEMKESAEELKKNHKKQASKKQDSAQQKMQKLSQQMKEAQEQMQEEGQTEDLNAMRQLLENLVQLSFDQEDVMNELKGLDRKDPKYVELGQIQRKLKDDAKMVEDSLFALSKRVVEIESVVTREMTAINQNMIKAIDLMTERKTSQVIAREQLVMTSLNNLALLFDEIIQQMQQQMSSDKFGEGSCNKPGSGKPSPASMKKMQQQLKQQMEQMKQQMGKGNKPGQGKGGKMSEQFAKMAAQQEAIRNQLRQMSEQLNNENGNKAGKNQIDELSKLMEETEVDLVNKRITQETIKRQEDIITRLLESEKAERERDKEERREAKEAKNEIFSNPEDFFEYKRLKQQQTELLKTVPPKLNSYYKKRVNEYFNAFE